MTDLVLFVRPPRPLWPLNGPSTAFWPPLAFASLAAALRGHLRDVRVEILDAPALQMGWRTLAAELERRRPAFVGIGEEAVSAVEGLRLARIAKACGASVIAGGCFFGHVAREVLGTGVIDVVVHGEGEQTIVELVDALRGGERGSLRQVAGISFRDSGEVVTTPPRPLVPDLDTLPLPAYDLLPVERYGRRSRNHPDFAALEASRGCIGSCGFCVLWRQMGRPVAGGVVAERRTKSPERLFDEIHVLRMRFGRRYLGWVDPSFNADAQVPGRLADLLLGAGVSIGQSAWVRADAVVRDAKSGALARMVRAGLNEVYLGLERPDPASLRALNKTITIDQTREAFAILAREHPGVFTFGSFIYGLPGDTAATIRAMYRLSVELQIDKALFIPLTPLPGTPFWRPELWDPTGRRFRSFDFLPSAVNNHDRAPLDRALFAAFLLDWFPARIWSYLRALYAGDARKRRMSWRLTSRSAVLTVVAFVHSVLHSGHTDGMVLPRWYES